MHNDEWPKKVGLHHADGRQTRGRSHKILNDVLSADFKSLNLSTENADNRAEW